MSRPRRPEQCSLPSPEERNTLREEINELITECIQNNPDLNADGNLGLRIIIAIVCPGEDNVFGPTDPFDDIEIPIGRPGVRPIRGRPSFPGKLPGNTGGIFPGLPEDDAEKDTALLWYIEYLKKRWDNSTRTPCPNPELRVGIECFNNTPLQRGPISRDYTNPILIAPPNIFGP